eukprot:2994927-Prymnesium_polylepis.1
MCVLRTCTKVAKPYLVLKVPNANEGWPRGANTAPTGDACGYYYRQANESCLLTLCPWQPLPAPSAQAG